MKFESSNKKQKLTPSESLTQSSEIRIIPCTFGLLVCLGAASGTDEPTVPFDSILDNLSLLARCCAKLLSSLIKDIKQISWDYHEKK